MIGQIDPFAVGGIVPQMPMMIPPPMPPKTKGGMNINTINTIQKGFIADGIGQAKPPVAPKGTAANIGLRPGWGGGE